MKYRLCKYLALSLMVTIVGCSFGKQDNSKELEADLAMAIQRSSQRAVDNVKAQKEAMQVNNLPGARAKDEIAPGYLIKLSAFEDSNIDGKYRVDFDGHLELPYDISLNVSGISFNSLKYKIIDAYRPYFRGTPDIKVSVASKDCYVEVGGLVIKPGRYLAKSNSTLDELIADAGGLQSSTPGSKDYAAKYVNIVQEGKSYLVRLENYYAGAEGLIPRWRGGDKIFFQSQGVDAASATKAERHYVQIIGQVTSPGEYTVEDGADFFYYLSKAGGPKNEADLSNLEVLRVVDGTRTSLKFSMKDVKKVPQVQGGDIIIVHSDKPSSGITNFSAMVGAVATSILAGAAL